MVALVAVAGLAVGFLGLFGHEAEPHFERVVGGRIVARLQRLVGVDLGQGGVVHDVRQRTLVLELAPLGCDAVGLGAVLVLVGLHLRCQLVVLVQRQVFAVDFDQLTPPQATQGNAHQVGGLVACSLLDAGDGDGFERGVELIRRHAGQLAGGAAETDV